MHAVQSPALHEHLGDRSGRESQIGDAAKLRPGCRGGGAKEIEVEVGKVLAVSEEPWIDRFGAGKGPQVGELREKVQTGRAELGPPVVINGEVPELIEGAEEFQAIGICQ